MPEEFIDDILKEVSNEGAIIQSDDGLENNSDSSNTEQPAKQEAEKDSDVVDKADKQDDQEQIQKDASDADADVNSVEKLAEQLGWNKDYQGEEKIDAATYILRSREIQDTMKGHNKDLKGQVNSLQESIKALQVHNESVFKAEVKKLEGELTRLKKEKRAAVELADVDKVDELDEQIETIQKDLDKPKPTETQKTDNSAYNDWIVDNKWYEQDEEMAAYANTVAEQYQGAPVERVYALVRQKVQEVFPDKFESTNKQEQQTQQTQSKQTKQDEEKAPVGPKDPVEGGANRDGKATFTVNDLTMEQRNIMNQFVRGGIMTEQQYVDDIAKLQEG